MDHRLRWHVPWILFVLVGCDPLGEAVVTLEVTSEAQARVGLPARVLVVAEGTECVRQVGVVEGEPAASLTVQWRESSVCPSRQVLRFWLEHDDSEAPLDGICVRRGNLPSSSEGVAVPVFERGDCNEGREDHRVRLP